MRSEVITRSTGFPPSWSLVLAVIAHPREESSGLGAILDAFIFAGAKVQMLCLTHGQTWALHAAPGDLAALRGAELASAADVLGATRAKLQVTMDSALKELSRTTLAAEVAAVAKSGHVDGLLVFDVAEVTGHLAEVPPTSAALLAAETLDLPVLGWTLSETAAARLNQDCGTRFTGHRDADIDLRVSVDRARQRLASHAHPKQALPGSAPRRRLELLAEMECLRWLRPPRGAVGDAASPGLPAMRFDAADRAPSGVEHPGGNQLDINSRDQVISVDHPVEDGPAGHNRARHNLPNPGPGR